MNESESVGTKITKGQLRALKDMLRATGEVNPVITESLIQRFHDLNGLKLSRNKQGRSHRGTKGGMSGNRG